MSVQRRPNCVGRQAPEVVEVPLLFERERERLACGLFALVLGLAVDENASPQTWRDVGVVSCQLNHHALVRVPAAIFDSLRAQVALLDEEGQ
jgi:hypothetical protein